jgi:hypothetical protein
VRERAMSRERRWLRAARLYADPDVGPDPMGLWSNPKAVVEAANVEPDLMVDLSLDDLPTSKRKTRLQSAFISFIRLLHSIPFIVTASSSPTSKIVSSLSKSVSYTPPPFPEELAPHLLRSSIPRP